MQFCLPNKELWANITWQCPLQINGEFNLVFVLLFCAILGVIWKVITIDWRSSGSLLYSAKEGEVSNKIDKFFASLINSIFSTRVVCGKGILWRAVRAENAYWQIYMFQLWLWYEYWVNLYMGFWSDPGFIVGTWNCQNCWIYFLTFVKPNQAEVWQNFLQVVNWIPPSWYMDF